MHKRCVEPVREIVGNPGDTNIIANMARAFFIRQAQIVQRGRDTVPVMVRDEKNGRKASLVAFTKGGRLLFSQDRGHDNPGAGGVDYFSDVALLLRADKRMQMLVRRKTPG